MINKLKITKIINTTININSNVMELVPLSKLDEDTIFVDVK